MIIALKWAYGSEQIFDLKLSDSERSIVNRQIENLDLDMATGCYGNREVTKTEWYWTELSLADLETTLAANADMLEFDFSSLCHLREVEFYLNGILIGKNINSHMEAKYIVPFKLLKKSGKNSLVAVIIKDSRLYIWPDMNGLQVMLPAKGKNQSELPKHLKIDAVHQYGRILTADRTGNHFRIRLSTGFIIEIRIWEPGIIRVTYHEAGPIHHEFLVDGICLDRFEKSLVESDKCSFYQDCDGYVINHGCYKVFLRESDFSITITDVQRQMDVFKSGRSFFSAETVGMRVGLDENEHVFGLGENGTPQMDKKGTREYIWVNHDFIRCDVPVPFYLSSFGYGLYLNNSFQSVFDIGCILNEEVLVWANGGRLDYFLILSQDLKDIVSEFSAITGRADLPPRWAFGYWQSNTRKETQQDMIVLIDNFRRKKIPIDVLHIDPYWMDNVTDLAFSKARYPDPRGFVQQLAEREIHLSLWTSPFVNCSSKHFKVAQRCGFFIRDEKAELLPVNWWLGVDAGLIDFTSDDAISWRRETIRKLSDMGVDVFKLDGGDGYEFPIESTTFSGKSGREVHNLYPLYFARAMHQIQKEMRPNSRIITWQRTGFTGSGRYPCTWGGDQYADFSGSRILIKAGQSAGLTGICFWSPDVGGFARCLGTTEEFFIRSFQWGLLSPLCRAHGNDNYPWSFGERAEAIIIRYIRLRYSLLPYLYSCAYQSVLRGIPMMRSMILEDSDDDESYRHDYQYFLGDSLLISPVAYPSSAADLSEEHDIYLPRGKWIDFWTEETYEGGRTYSYKAPIDILPIFVRLGSILPMYPIGRNAVDHSQNKLILHIYPSECQCEVCVFDDDGVSLAYKEGAYETLIIHAWIEAGIARIVIDPAKGHFCGQKMSTNLDVVIHMPDSKDRKPIVRRGIQLDKRTGIELHYDVQS